MRTLLSHPANVLNNPTTYRALDHFIERVMRFADRRLKKKPARRPEHKLPKSA